jgi:2'-5' RNA ligase
MRAFIAIELPLEIKNNLAKIQGKLKTTLPEINWVKPPHLHLSLKFLGEISLKQLESTRKMITEIIRTAFPFEIKLETLGVFPDCRRTRIIWIGTNQTPRQLKQLVDQLEAKLLKIGLPEKQHPFRAHITLGRIKNPFVPEDLARKLLKIKNDYRKANLKFNTRGIVLFQSVLGPKGPTYSILKKAIFQGVSSGS